MLANILNQVVKGQLSNLCLCDKLVGLAIADIILRKQAANEISLVLTYMIFARWFYMK
jgi:uncharacterized membrane protein YcaP (DUF421 family)